MGKYVILVNSVQQNGTKEIDNNNIGYGYK